jgi:hypothetical protein
MAGNHVASERELRIQVVEVPAQAGDLFEVGVGHLLIIVLRAACMLETDDGEVTLVAGDQALLSSSDRFRLKRVDSNAASTVELLWMPGPGG